MQTYCSCPPDRVEQEKERLERQGYEVLSVRTDPHKDVMHIAYRTRVETR